MARLDAIDRQILKELQDDGRITNVELADQISLSPSACLRRVRALERAGVIDRYVALVSPAAVGLPTTVFVEITLSSQDDDPLDAFEGAQAHFDGKTFAGGEADVSGFGAGLSWGTTVMRLALNLRSWISSCFDDSDRVTTRVRR